MEPADEAALLRHYILSGDDIERIRMRRGGHNRLARIHRCGVVLPVR